MIKKIIIGLFMILSIFFSFNVYSNNEETLKGYANEAKDAYNTDKKAYDLAKKNFENLKKTNPTESELLAGEQKYLQALNDYESSSDNLKKANSDLHKTQCGEGGSSAGKCLDQPTFMIGVDETLGVGIKVDGKNTSQVINKTLGTVIQKLMVALGVLAVLIMTIGAGYIIMYHGQDELLSKGKSIFMSGITALVVALSSYYLVAILRYILYK